MTKVLLGMLVLHGPHAIRGKGHETASCGSTSLLVGHLRGLGKFVIEAAINVPPHLAKDQVVWTSAGQDALCDFRVSNLQEEGILEEAGMDQSPWWSL